MSPGQRPQVGDVVAWRRNPGWAFGIVEDLGRVSAGLRVIAGSPSKSASRPYSALHTVLTADQFVCGLTQCLEQALAAVDGAGPVADGAGRR